MSGQHHAVAALPTPPPPREDTVPTAQDVGRASGPVRTARKISTPPGFDTRLIQPVASRYTIGKYPFNLSCVLLVEPYL
jgi:hypothetical protein